MEGHLVVRKVTLEDCAECAKVDYFGVHVSVEDATLEVERIVREPISTGIVVENQLGIIGVMIGIPITDRFAKCVLGGTSPFFHHTVRQSRESPFPTEDHLGKLNAHDGTHLFITHFSTLHTLPNELKAKTFSVLVEAFCNLAAGNRHKSLLLETLGKESSNRALLNGFQVVRDYSALNPGAFLPDEHPYLVQMTLNRAVEVGNYHAVKLLSYRNPVFKFPPAAREILRLAIAGIGDPELVRSGFLNQTTINSRWTRIFDIVERVSPIFFGVDSSGKSRRNRQDLLNYIRIHPEELWPYEG